MSDKRSNAEILDAWFERMVAVKQQRMETQRNCESMDGHTIRYDRGADLILIPYPNGCGDYEVVRWRFADRAAIETLVDELSGKKWLTAVDVAAVRRIAFAVMG